MKVMDWDKVKAAFEVYLKDPSPSNAHALLDIIPMDKTREVGNRDRAIERIWAKLMLEKRVAEGERYSAEVIFRLLNFSDAGVSEWLSGILGDLVETQPQLFLELLNKYQCSTYIKTAGYPVDNTARLKVSMEARIHSWNTRISALETIKNASLIELRAECIRILRNDLASPRLLRYLNPEYKEIFNLFDSIRFPDDLLSTYLLDNTPKWNVEQIMRYVSKSGIVFYDIKDGFNTIMPPEKIEAELKSRKGRFYELISQLAYTYSLPYNQENELRLVRENDMAVLFITDCFKLVFKKVGTMFYLVSCSRIKLAYD
jgi:hypothetical protein